MQHNHRAENDEKRYNKHQNIMEDLVSTIQTRFSALRFKIFPPTGSHDFRPPDSYLADSHPMKLTKYLTFFTPISCTGGVAFCMDNFFPCSSETTEHQTHTPLDENSWVMS